MICPILVYDDNSNFMFCCQVCNHAMIMCSSSLIFLLANFSEAQCKSTFSLVLYFTYFLDILLFHAFFVSFFPFPPIDPHITCKIVLGL